MPGPGKKEYLEGQERAKRRQQEQQQAYAPIQQDVASQINPTGQAATSSQTQAPQMAVPSSQQISDLLTQIQSQKSQVQNRQAPTLGGNLAYSGTQKSNLSDLQKYLSTLNEQTDVQKQQSALIDTLTKQSQGQGTPSIAEMQLKDTQNRNIANQIALAQRAGNVGTAQRQAASNIGSLNQEAAGQSAQLRAQEQSQARQELASVIGTARTQDQAGQQLAVQGFQTVADIANTANAQDLQKKTTEAQLKLQQTGLNDQQIANINSLAVNTLLNTRAQDIQSGTANLQAQLQQQGLNNSQIQYFTELAFRTLLQDKTSAQAYQNLLSNTSLQNRALDISERGQDLGVLGSILGAAGTIGAALV